MTKLYICEECRTFSCMMVDKHHELAFKAYELPCLMRMRTMGFFVLDTEFHMFDKLPPKGDNDAGTA